MKFLILGCGPTGLGSAWRLNELGESDWRVLEASDHAGGLATSFQDPRGFTWDIGGHVQFSHYEYFDRLMDELLSPEGWLKHQRESWVWMRDRFIPYPFQNNIHRLPPDDLDACLKGLVELYKSPPAKPASFRDWILAVFGAGIADIFMLPYNFKVWAYPPEMMNAVWVGERVATTDLARVLHNLVYGKDDLSWGPNNLFHFPLRGGTGAIWKECARRLPPEKFSWSCPVVSVDLKKRQVQTKSGEILQYEYLISTIPLTELIKLSGVSDEAGAAKTGLLHSASNIVGIGLEGRPSEDLRAKCWMYFPEANCPFYRVTVFSNYSPFNVPDSSRHWSLMTETSESSMKPVNHQTLVDEVISGLRNVRLLKETDKIVSKWSYRAEYGYPTPGLHRDAALDQIIPRFERHNVFPRGRFGAWKYEVANQDHSFMQGLEIIERLVHGRPEVTLPDPNHANSRKHPFPFERWNGTNS